jgi:hypothetical protein
MYHLVAHEILVDRKESMNSVSQHGIEAQISVVVEACCVRVSHVIYFGSNGVSIQYSKTQTLINQCSTKLDMTDGE